MSYPQNRIETRILDRRSVLLLSGFTASMLLIPNKADAANYFVKGDEAYGSAKGYSYHGHININVDTNVGSSVAVIFSCDKRCVAGSVQIISSVWHGEWLCGTASKTNAVDTMSFPLTYNSTKLGSIKINVTAEATAEIRGVGLLSYTRAGVGTGSRGNQNDTTMNEASQYQPAIGIHGIKGYVYTPDIALPSFTNSQECVTYYLAESGTRYVNVYADDHCSIIDQYPIYLEASA